MDGTVMGLVIDLLLPAVLVIMLVWAGLRRRPSTYTVSDEKADRPYRVYTRQFDLELMARDVPAALRANVLLRVRGWVSADTSIWRRKVSAAREVSVDADGTLSDQLNRALSSGTPANWAICFLVDQSGSMKDAPIRETAAALRWCSDVLTAAGIKVAILGYSTVGWQGGEAATQWVADGRPKRPGRLAALLHVHYQRFGEAMGDADWSVMLHPDILRENIDGEAIAWAGSQLDERPEARRLLIVLSDGAPVDDATLMHNGPSYLWRHLLKTVATRETASRTTLAAIGLNHRVDDLYKRSRSVTDPANLPDVFTGFLVELIGDPSQIVST